MAYRASGNGTHGATEMPYNPETEQFFQAPATIVDSTPDGDTVQEGFDDRLTPAMTGVYTDLNLLKENGMIGVGIPATTTSRGIGRVATLADMEPDAVIENGPAVLAAGSDAERLLLRVTEKYNVGEFYYFRHPTLKPGFAPLQGGLISGAYQGKNITEYPIWAYLQTAEGQLLLKTEAEWQARSTATWATLADGTKVGWNGIGGVPFYVQNLATGTLRLPDLRGMYAEAAGFDSLDVGAARGDQGRNVSGSLGFGGEDGSPSPSTGPFYLDGTFKRFSVMTDNTHSWVKPFFDISRVVPTGASFAPRRWGALACCYLGKPA